MFAGISEEARKAIQALSPQQELIARHDAGRVCANCALWHPRGERGAAYLGACGHEDNARSARTFDDTCEHFGRAVP